jgi:hypothetical protein
MSYAIQIKHNNVLHELPRYFDKEENALSYIRKKYEEVFGHSLDPIQETDLSEDSFIYDEKDEDNFYSFEFEEI